MASFSFHHHYFRGRSTAIQELKRGDCSKHVITVSCTAHDRQHDDPAMQEPKKEKQSKRPTFAGIVEGFEKIGKGLKHNLGPQRKGDWKDLALMSLSFAVYVYISQKIVCAYCAWVSMPKQPW
ncbi:hypothetical protein ACJRO7_004148 [Eucalyptus globulus]|uniref:Uncharacterized protein n=1 Tax=Eucalyptus globulus TaxID=34317 RepID=A0ABD3IYP6_EUCGL